MALTLLNLNNRFPQWADRGFVPQKLSGGSRTSAGFNVYEDTETGELSTNLDWWSLLPANWEDYTYVYVDPVNGSDSNSGLTTALPKKSLAAGLGIAGTKVMWCRTGVYNYAEGFKGTAINETTIILPWPGDQGQITATNRLTQTGGGFSVTADTTSGVWVWNNISNSSSSIYVASDLTIDLDETGRGRIYTTAATLADCRATAKSYFIQADGASNYDVYVNTGSTDTPSTSLLHILRATSNCAPWAGGADNGYNFYAYDMTLIGGDRPFVALVASGTLTQSTIALYNVQARYTTPVSARANWTFECSKDIYLFNCWGEVSSLDNFSYKAYNAGTFGTETPTPAQVVEINCYAQRANETSINSSGNNLSNCSTIHADVKIIRLNCRFQKAHGGVIHDVSGTGSGARDNASLNLGVWAADSVATADNNAGKSDFAFGIDDNEKMTGWCFRCQNVDWSGNASTSTYYIRNRDTTSAPITTVYADNNQFNNTNQQAGTITGLPGQ